jgi:hypothetical protein
MGCNRTLVGDANKYLVLTWVAEFFYGTGMCDELKCSTAREGRLPIFSGNKRVAPTSHKYEGAAPSVL